MRQYWDNMAIILLTFEFIFMYKDSYISSKFHLKYLPMGPIDNKPSLQLWLSTEQLTSYYQSSDAYVHHLASMC